MVPQAAAEQYRQQQAIAATTAAAVRRTWRRMGDDFDVAYARVGPTLLATVELGRAAAVDTAMGYTGRVLEETGQPNAPVGQLQPGAFLATAPDGRAVDTLLAESVIGAKVAVKKGATSEAALAQSGRWLTTVTLTLLADTRREVYGADIIQRPEIAGYVRMLNPPSCARCITLAGKWFRWNQGFLRHPRCDCQHIPSAEDMAGDLRTDPYEMFRSLSPADQERTFGRSEARSIRDGADIYRVMNVQQRGLATARGAARYGTPSRMTVDDIYRVAGTRTNAIRMMRQEGYILDRGQVAIARSPGVRTDAQIIAAGRGRGAVTIAGQRQTTNRAAQFDAASTGERDVLRRSTMTAAERRIYDANYRLQYARRTGTVPRSIGENSADRNTRPIPATPARIAELERSLARLIADLRNQPASVRRVAQALGLI